MIPLLVLLLQSSPAVPHPATWTAEVSLAPDPAWRTLAGTNAIAQWTPGAPDDSYGVLAYEPGRMLAFRPKGAAAAFFGASHDVLSLEPTARGTTRLRLVRVPGDTATWPKNAQLLVEADGEALRRRLEQAPAATTREDKELDRALVVEGPLAAPPEEAWRIFSTAEGWKKLGVAQAEVDLRVGGAIRTHYDAQAQLGGPGTIVHRVLAFEPDRMLATEFARSTLAVDPRNEKARGALGTWVVITLTPIDATRTRMREAMYGWPDTPAAKETRSFFDAGNRWTLQHLQQQFPEAR